MRRLELRTVKIDLKDMLDAAAKERLLETMKQCQEVFNFFGKLGCKHKTVSYIKLHHLGYKEMTSKFPDLPTSYVQQTAKQALACLDAFNTQQKNLSRKYHNKAVRFAKKGKEDKAKEFEEKSEKCKARIWNYEGCKTSFQLCLNKTSLSRRGNLTTFSCIGKRIRIMHDIPNYFSKKYDTDQKKLQSGFVIYDERAKRFLLFLSFKIEAKECEGTEIVGIDRGLYNIAALSDGTIYTSKKHIGIKRKYQYLRFKLQQKGTRSAKRLLKKRSRREKRFMRDVNHCITKQLASRKDVSTYVLEDLTHIRTNTEEKGKKKKNSWLSNWSFSEFQLFLTYKCWDNGIRVEYVDPRYTSQKCNKCGKVEKSNRQKGKYICSCGYSNHADINAALNIRDNYVSSLQGEQGAVNHPYATVEQTSQVTRD